MRRLVEMPPGVSATTITTERTSHAVLVAEAEGARGVVVLVPGWTGSKEDFAAILPLLAARGFRAVAIDQRGQHESPGIDDASAYTLDALAADLVSLTQSVVRRDVPVHVVGHSFGGLVTRAAVRAAVADGLDVFASMTLMCSGPGGVPPADRELLTSLADSVLEDGLATSWERLLAHEREAGVPRQSPEIEAFLQRRFRANHPVSLEQISRVLASAVDDIDATSDALAKADIPVLVVYGADDNRWPVAEQEAMAHRLGVGAVVVDGAAHSPAVERPDVTAGVLADFCAAVSSTSPPG